MIKSEINEASVIGNDYPKLMIGTTELVVLMTSLGIGVVVASGTSKHGVGYSSINWKEGGHLGLKDFHGSVTLSNEGGL